MQQLTPNTDSLTLGIQMQLYNVATIMESLKRLYGIARVIKFQSSKNGSNFMCEKGTFSQIRSHLMIPI